MERQPDKPSWRARMAWAAIAGFVVLYDATCPKGETLSEELSRMRQTKIGNKVVPWLVDSVSDHLLERVEPEKDWIHNVGTLFDKE